MTFDDKCHITESIFDFLKHTEIPTTFFELTITTDEEAFIFYVSEKAKWILANYYIGKNKADKHIEEYIWNSNLRERKIQLCDNSFMQYITHPDGTPCKEDIENSWELLFERGRELYFNSSIENKQWQIGKADRTSYVYDYLTDFHDNILQNFISIPDILSIDILNLTYEQHNVLYSDQILFRLLQVLYPNMEDEFSPGIEDYSYTMNENKIREYLEPEFNRYYHNHKKITYEDFKNRQFSFQKAYEISPDFTDTILSCISYNHPTDIHLLLKVLDTNNGFDKMMNELSTESVFLCYGKIHIVERLNEYFHSKKSLNNTEKYYHALFEKSKHYLQIYFYGNDHYLLEDGLFMLCGGDGDSCAFGSWNINFLYNYFIAFLVEMESELKKENNIAETT